MDYLNGTYLKGTTQSIHCLCAYATKAQASRHSRAGGNPGGPQKPLDSRLRGNDEES